jgi:hypothetical protein
MVVMIGAVDRLKCVGEQEGTTIYTAVVNCVTLKREVRIVYWVKNTPQGLSVAWLFSTDTTELEHCRWCGITRRGFKSSFCFGMLNSLLD